MASYFSRFHGYLVKHWRYLTTAGAYPGIDAYRALAIFMVVLFHQSIAPFGWLGVDVFFVISGFLIGGMIIDRLQKGAWSFARFYHDRALRILPLYYGMLALTVAVEVSRSPQQFSVNALKTIAASLVFAHTTPDWLLHWKLDPDYMVAGSWSLVIEEYFYLVAPLAIFYLFRSFKGRLDILAAILSVVAAALLTGKLILAQIIQPHQFLPFYFHFPFKFDALIFGVIAAACTRRFKPNGTAVATLLILGGAAVLTSLLFLHTTPGWRVPTELKRDVAWLPAMFASGVAVMIVASYRWRLAPVPVVIIARLAYPLYLGHIFLFGFKALYEFFGLSYESLGFFGMSIVPVHIALSGPLSNPR